MKKSILKTRQSQSRNVQAQLFKVRPCESQAEDPVEVNISLIENTSTISKSVEKKVTMTDSNVSMEVVRTDRKKFSRTLSNFYHIEPIQDARKQEQKTSAPIKQSLTNANPLSKQCLLHYQPSITPFSVQPTFPWFLRTPTKTPLTFLIEPNSQQPSYSIFFSPNQQLLRCTIKDQTLIFLNRSITYFTLLTSTKNMYIPVNERREPTEEMFVIKYGGGKGGKSGEKSRGKSERRRLRMAVMAVEAGQTRLYRTREPKNQNGRQELKIDQNRGIPMKQIRPSQYHCVVEDEQGNEVCLILEHNNTYIIWTSPPITPMIAISCAISRCQQLSVLTSLQPQKTRPRFWSGWFC